MLTELRIRNVAIIDSVTLSLGPGFNVLSGETGAGKSIVVGALGLLFGSRSSAELVRPGAEKATVEGTFDISGNKRLAALLDERGIDMDDGASEVVLRREVTSAGRSRAWINNSAATSTLLADVGSLMVTIHGQHEARGLLDATEQRDILDAFGGAADSVTGVSAAWERVQVLRRSIKELETRRDEARKRSDYLRHVVAELEEAKLIPGEDDALEDEVRRLSHVQELLQHAAHVREALDDEDRGALRQLGTAQRALDAAARLDPSIERLRELLDNGFAQLEELARELQTYESSLDTDPARLAEVERRRDLVFSLTRKHGGSVESALQGLGEARAELDLVDSAEFDLGKLSLELRDAERELVATAKELTSKRNVAAERISRDVTRIFPDVGLSGGRLEVSLSARNEIERDGAESVEFVVTLNPGHPLRPLARVASGGELSRIMLALTTILARLDRVSTLVFDEVDSGIGGKVALTVGDTLKRVAADHQVLAITHLPQIASRAHRQVVVSKAARGGVTSADLHVVEGEARVLEVARMLGGDPESDTSRAHARELLEQSVPPSATPAAKSGKRRARP